MVKNAEQHQYLVNHVDPVLKPLIKRAVKGKQGFPSDFKRWLHSQLCLDFGEKQKFSTAAEAVEEAAQFVGLSKQAFATLDPANYEGSIGAFAQLCSSVGVLGAQYAQDREEEEKKKRAAEEKRKREEALRDAAQAQSTAAVVGRQNDGDDQPLRLFMSYARGTETTNFARKVKNYLEEKAGFSVWMDESDIGGGVDFMEAIGKAIKNSAGIIAVIDERFNGSTYCENELVMAQGNGLQIFPLLFRSMEFQNLPDGVQYMLASTNCLPFRVQTDDGHNLAQLVKTMHNIFRQQLPKHQMRHTDKSLPKVPHAASDEPAKIPMAVPELPSQLATRPEIISILCNSLLPSPPPPSSTDVKKNEVTAMGQGGVGKTVTAALVVQNAEIRKAYDQIGWVSMGQTANIPELQKQLYEQLTGETMPAITGAVAEKQLDQLRAAGIGRRWLVVLDDIWLPEQYRQLNCVDPASGSGVLITTRIRELIEGCKEVRLNILTEAESIRLLLETGKVTASDAASRAAAEIAKACEYLPLYLSICGGMIAHYQDDDAWQTELLAELQRDRIGLIEDQTGDSTVAICVDASLRMVDEFSRSALMALGVCPEDVWIRHDVAKLICSADEQVLANGKVTLMAVKKGICQLFLSEMRKTVKLLLDRNLLQGSVQEGFKMHDIVRELIRSRLGDSLRSKQRAVVQAFVAAYPFDPLSVIGRYAAGALRLHMEEAILLLDPFDDPVAQSWLDAGDENSDLLTNQIIRSASSAMGHAVVAQLGQKFETQGNLWKAARRYYSSTLCRVWDGDLDFTGLAEVCAPICDLLQRAPQTPQSRTLEFTIRSRMARTIKWGSALYFSNIKRLTELMEQGIVANTPEMLLAMARADYIPVIDGIGSKETESNFQNPEAYRKLFNDQPVVRFAKYTAQAFAMVPREDSRWLAVAWKQLDVADLIAGRQYAAFRNISAQHATHSLLSEWVDRFSLKELSRSQTAVGIYSLRALMGFPATYSLMVYGDVPLARKFMLKVHEIFASGIQTEASNTIRDIQTYVPFIADTFTNPYFRRAGLKPLSLKLMTAMHCTWNDVEGIAPRIAKTRSYLSWVGERCCYAQTPYFITQMRRRNFLLDPNCVSEAAMRDWLRQVPAEWGTSAQSDLIDADPASFGGMCGGGCALVFEELGLYTQAITAAQADIANWRCNPVMLIQSYTAIGRSQAKLGNTSEAVSAFEAAIEEAQLCELPFLEMFAHDDYIVSVLDGQSNRDSQMAALGQCISRMVLPPEQYSHLLSSGIDATAAVAAFNSSQTSK